MTETFKPRRWVCLLAHLQIALYIGLPVFFFFWMLGFWWIGFILFMLPFTYNYLWYLNASYVLEDSGIRVNTGVFSRNRSLFLYNQIQKVLLTQNFYQKFIGIAEVKISTLSTGSKISGVMKNMSLKDAQIIQSELEFRMAPQEKTPGASPNQPPLKQNLKRPPAPQYPINVIRGSLSTSLIIILTLLFLLGLVTMFAVLVDDDANSLYLSLLLICISLSQLVLNYFIYSGMSYNTSDKWLELKQTFLSNVSLRVSFDRIQDVVLQQSFSESIFGLKTLIVSAGGASISIPALKTKDAENMADYILNRLDLDQKDMQDITTTYPLERSSPLSNTLTWAYGFTLLLGIGFLGSIFASNLAILDNAYNDFFSILPYGLSVAVVLLIFKYLYERAFRNSFVISKNDKLFSISKGVFGISTYYLPYSRIQHLVVIQNIWNRFFGLSQVIVQTLGVGFIRINGLTSQNAKKLKFTLMTRITAASQKR